MNAYQCWEAQRDPLRTALKDQNNMADVVYAVRHAILQTEQNALADQTDDVLRQQMGVLFSMLKSAVAFIAAPVTATSWVAQSHQAAKKQAGKVTLVSLTALIIVAGGLLSYFRGLWLGWVLALAALITGSLALMSERKARRQAMPKDEVRVTLQPDVDKLLSVIDGQMRAIDRCANDYAYLNDSLRGDRQTGGAAMVSRIADLLEALYVYDEETRAPAWEAVQDMLHDMGLKALEYSEESRKLFTALPSKNETRTITPAIVSVEDLRLLKRGTAAVKMDAA